MKHQVMGVKRGEDFPLFQQPLSIATSDLKIVMGWENEEEFQHDYRLTEQQIIEIEKSCAITLPRDLDLYLSTQI
ncbi:MULTISPECIES: hypothetical protein [unclassified Pseudomonas]|uniref:hypothetical protein n=1 Tax=unclassified Pseudomonas TaxID=196821 RepID=UPI000D46C327|nr:MULTISPECIES: hypothetical protein [unclassified Pseudomonas]PTS97058.1 hypothetical protein DBR24_17485 [Pseudomonas sp. HMWF006]PTT65062.1 hypothetical protein DBR26_19760 [Pseudomonas sp. HMWF007]PTT82668.1 hypothetical protein DBR29_26440 [Pseudomonas sp. HMWF005]